MLSEEGFDLIDKNGSLQYGCIIYGYPDNINDDIIPLVTYYNREYDTILCKYYNKRSKKFICNEMCSYIARSLPIDFYKAKDYWCTPEDLSNPNKVANCFCRFNGLKSIPVHYRTEMGEYKYNFLREDGTFVFGGQSLNYEITGEMDYYGNGKFAMDVLTKEDDNIIILFDTNSEKVVAEAGCRLMPYDDACDVFVKADYNNRDITVYMLTDLNRKQIPVKYKFLTSFGSGLVVGMSKISEKEKDMGIIDKDGKTMYKITARFLISAFSYHIEQTFIPQNQTYLAFQVISDDDKTNGKWNIMDKHHNLLLNTWADSIKQNVTGDDRYSEAIIQYNEVSTINQFGNKKVLREPAKIYARAATDGMYIYTLEHGNTSYSPENNEYFDETIEEINQDLNLWNSNLHKQE